MNNDMPSTCVDNKTNQRPQAYPSHEPTAINRASMPHEEVDHFPMPTPDQVARSMSFSLKFREVCRHQQEREIQIAEGRRMARAESQGPRNQSQEFRPAPQQQCFDANAPAKKRRNRNRNKNKSFTHAPVQA